jgi:hypothetical protein
MMGDNGGDQNRLFYSFNLDAHVPASRLLRGIIVRVARFPSTWTWIELDD